MSLVHYRIKDILSISVSIISNIVRTRQPRSLWSPKNQVLIFSVYYLLIPAQPWHITRKG